MTALRRFVDALSIHADAVATAVMVLLALRRFVVAEVVDADAVSAAVAISHALDRDADAVIAQGQLPTIAVRAALGWVVVADVVDAVSIASAVDVLVALWWIVEAMAVDAHGELSAVRIRAAFRNIHARLVSADLIGRAVRVLIAIAVFVADAVATTANETQTTVPVGKAQVVPDADLVLTPPARAAVLVGGAAVADHAVSAEAGLVLLAVIVFLTRTTQIIATAGRK